MRSHYVYTRNILTAVLFLFYYTATAQQGFYVPITGKIFFNGDTATIFSNVINQGRFGVGKNAFVNFTGRVWENDPQSMITDESFSGSGAFGLGGWVRFLSDSIRQQLKGGYNVATKTGPLFGRLRIQNKKGIDLSETSTKVRNEIRFSDGRIYLNDLMMAVGDNNPGKISGYDSLHYFVTGNKAGSGLLIRENIRSSDGRIDFPVGSRDNSYTPAAVLSNTVQGDDYYVNVFDSVRANRLSGKNLFSESVNKTWEIGKRYRPGIDEAEIFLQHINSDEGSFFKQNKKNAYVAWYNGNSWDTGSPQKYPAQGYLTSGPTLINSGVNSRVFYNTVAAPSYFTKLTGFGDSALQTILWFNARRNGDSTVYVYWNTKPEVYVKYFVVERRLSNETNFSQRDTVASQISGGISFSQHNYSDTDPNSYRGISFYRLKVVNMNGTFFYSNIIAVVGIAGGPLNMIWPNPTTDVFFVSCDPVWQVEAIVIWNAIGQRMKVEKTNGRNIIQMSGLLPGTYFVGLIRVSGEVIETKKLVVTGK